MYGGPATRKEWNMASLEIRTVRLERMRVASALGFGKSPEREAWGKMRPGIQ